MKKKFSEWTKNVKAKVQKIQQYTAYKVATSKALDRTVSITMAGFAILGITAAAIPAAIVGLTTVAIGAVTDTLTLRNTRRLIKEQKLLSTNRSSIENQNAILEQNPKLAEALKGELLTTNRENKKSTTERYIKPGHKTNRFDFGKAILKNIANSVFSIGKAAISGKVLGTAIAIGKSAKSLYSENSVNNAISNKRQEFYQAIDSERDKPDTPGYNSLRELREAVREQRIQKMALEEMQKDDKFNHLTPEEIRKEFQKKKIEVENRVEKISALRNPVIHAITSFGKDFIRAHNPFSKYNNINELQIQRQSINNPAKPLQPQKESDKTVNLEQTVEKVKEIRAELAQKGHKARTRSSTIIPKKKPPQTRRMSI